MVLTYYAEEQPNEPEQDDDEPMNPLVDALFDEVENLRLQVNITIDSP
jgi:kinesin family protein 20